MIMLRSLSLAIKVNQNRIKLSIKRTDDSANKTSWLQKASLLKVHKNEFAEIEFQFLDWNDRETSNCARFLLEREIFSK